MSISPTIMLDQVTKRYAAELALEKVIATIHPGEFVAVIVILLIAAMEVVVELLWYGFVAVYALGAALYVGLGYRAPRCRDCQTSALMLSRQVAGSFPPVFEVVYRCPTCGATLWKHFVSSVND